MNRPDPDPLTIWPVDPTEPRATPGITVPLVVAIAILVVLIVAASRSGSAPSHQVPTQTGTPNGQAMSDGADLRASQGVPGEDTPIPIETRLAGDGAAAGLNPPAATPTWSGTATWFCSATSACPRGYGPSDLVAAIDRKDSPFRRGDRVVVRYHCGKGCDRHVTVRIVDVCRCGGARLIDLTSGAFRRLAPLGQGVIPVTIEAAGAAVTPPATDEEQP